MILFPYGEPIQWLRYDGTTDDGMGNEVPSWADPVAIEFCAVDPGTTIEPRDGLSERVVISPRIYVPKGFAIGPLDKLVRRSETYEVEGYPADWVQSMTGWDPGYLIVTVKRIEG